MGLAADKARADSHLRHGRRRRTASARLLQPSIPVDGPSNYY